MFMGYGYDCVPWLKLGDYPVHSLFGHNAVNWSSIVCPTVLSRDDAISDSNCSDQRNSYIVKDFIN